MAIDISSTTRRIVYTGSAGVGPYAFAFEVLAQTDIAVYFNTTELTLTTDYTVTVNADGTGSVTIVTGSSVPSTPTSSDRITIIGDRTIQRTTDFTTGGPLFATSLNDEFDSQTIFTQQVLEQADRSLRAPNTDPTTINMVLPINTTRASKFLSFDADGNPQAVTSIGTYKGNWAASTSYVLYDIVKDTSNNNIYICTVAHTSSGSQPISTNADSGKWGLIVDAVTASGFADEAEAWATKTDGIVESTDYSSKAWSIGGTGVTTTSGKGAAKEWATSTGAAVDTSEYSAKEYAIGNLTASGGSAKAWAEDASSPDGTTTKSAKTHASEAATSASNASSSASAASSSASSAASSASAASSSASAASSSASAASSSASAAAASEAAAAAYADNFDDTYLGAKASDPTLDNDGNALQDGALYFDTTNDVMKVYDLGTTTWYPLTPTVSNQANINTVAGIAADVTTVAGIDTDVTTVSGNSANVTTVAGISGNVTTVAGISANVTTVAGNTSNINTVATNDANVTTVAGISGNVTTVAGISADVTAVASDASDIGTVATNIANVNSVATNIASVNTVATNVADVVTFATTYLGAFSSAPSTSVTGALYYNTTGSQLYIWNGSVWDPAAFSASGTVTSFNTRTGAITLTSGDVTSALTYTPYDAANVSAFGGTLIDDADAATARTTLGLGTAATTASTDYATAAQGTLADSAVQPSDNISTLTNDSGFITGNQTITLSGDASGSGTTSIAVTVADNSHNHTSANISDATNLNTASTIVKRDASGNFSAGTITASLSGNATTSSSTTGNAATATTWQTGRTIALTGDVTGTSGTFDGSANLSFATNIAANVVGANELNVTGNGTAGQYLASDGDGTMTWTTLAAGGGFSNMQVFTSPGTWTNPGSVTRVKVTVTGGGGGGNSALRDPAPQKVYGTGAGGGTAIEVLTIPTSPVAVTVGGGGAGSPVTPNAVVNAAGSAGGTSSFGAYCSASGGGAQPASADVSAINGGVGSGGTINLQGGYACAYLSGNIGDTNNMGGSSYWGNGAGQSANGTTATAGINASNYGSGGGSARRGTAGSAQGGGAGASGVVVVEW